MAMDIHDALLEADFEALAETLPGTPALSLLGALTEAPSRDVGRLPPDGLWHLAQVRWNTLTLEGAEPIPAEAWQRGAALRAALVRRAERGQLTSRRAPRSFSDAGYFVVRADGAWRAMVPPGEEVAVADDAGETARLSIDVLDRVERAALAPSGEPGWHVAADSSLGDGPNALGRLFPASLDTVLSCATREPPAAAHAALTTLGLSARASAAGLIRWTPRALTRTLYAGDLAAADDPSRVEIIMLVHRRLWAPPG